jgi:hypothetical protein
MSASIDRIVGALRDLGYTEAPALEIVRALNRASLYVGDAEIHPQPEAPKIVDRLVTISLTVMFPENDELMVKIYKTMREAEDMLITDGLITHYGALTVSSSTPEE